jgi:hypothetical protein
MRQNQAPPPDMLHMTFEQLFPKKWLSPEHLQGRTAKAHIKRASVEKVWDARINNHTFKNCLWFEGKEKGLLLNQTQTAQLFDVTGAKTVAQSIGHTIVLRPTSHRGKFTIAIDAMPTDLHTPVKPEFIEEQGL